MENAKKKVYNKNDYLVWRGGHFKVKYVIRFYSERYRKLVC